MTDYAKLREPAARVNRMVAGESYQAVYGQHPQTGATYANQFDKDRRILGEAAPAMLARLAELEAELEKWRHVVVPKSDSLISEHVSGSPDRASGFLEAERSQYCGEIDDLREAIARIRANAALPHRVKQIADEVLGEAAAQKGER